MINCADARLPIRRVSQLAQHSGASLPIIAIDPDGFSEAKALETLLAGANTYGSRDNPAFIAKLVEQQLNIRGETAMSSDDLAPDSFEFENHSSSYMPTQHPVAYLVDGVIAKANLGFAHAVGSDTSDLLIGQPINQFARRGDNPELMRSIRRAMRGESLELNHQDPIQLKAIDGDVLKAIAVLEQTRIDGEMCTSITLITEAASVSATRDSDSVPEGLTATIDEHAEAEDPNAVISIDGIEPSTELVAPGSINSSEKISDITIELEQSVAAAKAIANRHFSMATPQSIARPIDSSNQPNDESANDHRIPQNELSELLEQAINSRCVSPEWRTATSLAPSGRNNLSKLSVRITGDDGDSWLLDRAEHDFPARQLLQLDQWGVRQAIKATKKSAAKGDWLVQLSPLALSPRFIQWLDGKLAERGENSEQRIIFCVSESSIINNEDGFHAFSAAVRKTACGVSLEEIRDAAHSADMLTLLKQEKDFPTEYITLSSDTLITGCDDLGQLLSYCKTNNVLTSADSPSSAQSLAQLWFLGINFVVGGLEASDVVQIEHAADASQCA